MLYQSMIIRPKHYLLFIMGLLLAGGIFYVNYYVFFGNPLERCLYLSFFTFLFWWLCWGLYFEIRDFWQFRWYGPHVECKNIRITPISIPLSENSPNNSKKTELRGEIIMGQNSTTTTPLIIFVHGFSDDSEYIRHFTIPISYSGFDVLAYDNRGTKKSRKVGSSSQFIEITDDLNQVITYISESQDFANKPIYLVGISLGAIAVLKQGLIHVPEKVKKIVAIAAMANYKFALPFSPVPFLKNWWLWLRYTFFGVPVNPPQKQNFELSPIQQAHQKRLDFPNEAAWKDFTTQYFSLCHAQNDQVIENHHFWENIEEFSLDSTSWMITEKGGHNFLRNEGLLLGEILFRLKSD